MTRFAIFLLSHTIPNKSINIKSSGKLPRAVKHWFIQIFTEMDPLKLKYYDIIKDAKI